MDNRLRKLITIFVCIAFSLLGLTVQIDNSFKPKKSIEEVTESYDKGTTMDTSAEASTSDLNSSYLDYENTLKTNTGDSDVETTPELFSSDTAISIYFTNTSSIDGNFLPLDAQKNISKATQSFLRTEGLDKATEIEVIDDTAKKTEEKESFQCSVKDYDNEVIQIVFDNKTGEFSFSRVKTVE